MNGLRRRPTRPLFRPARLAESPWAAPVLGRVRGRGTIRMDSWGQSFFAECGWTLCGIADDRISDRIDLAGASDDPAR
jgi:hypothetical protein